MLLLPSIQLALLALILLDKLLEHLLQSIRVDLQRRQYILNRPLHQHAVDQAEAFSLFWERAQGFLHELVLFDLLLDFADFLRQRLERVLEVCIL